MKILLSILIFGFILFSCKNEEKVYPPCTLQSLDSSRFVGMVHLCNAKPGLQLDFDAKALINVKDSILILSISSLDSTIVWNHLDSAKYECVYPEGNLSYKLYSIIDGTNTGYLMHGTGLSFTMHNVTCDHGLLSGWLVE